MNLNRSPRTVWLASMVASNAILSAAILLIRWESGFIPLGDIILASLVSIVIATLATVVFPTASMSASGGELGS